MMILESPDLSAVIRLLQSCDLPWTDIKEDHMQTFLYEGDRSNPGGIIGLEVFGSVALLRSLVVGHNSRNLGVGRALLDAAERQAKKHGVSELYLLTETAAPFFETTGYVPFERNQVPDPIAVTVEFSSLCPGTATCMMKRLS